jgi:xanthine dehydrogenase YagS FAD-binding subunit
MALDATIRVVGPDLDGEISLAELYTKPTESHRQMTILGPGELIVEIRVPTPKGDSRGVYLKAMERQSWSFALVSVAAQLNFEGERISLKLEWSWVGSQPSRGGRKMLKTFSCADRNSLKTSRSARRRLL